MRGHDLDYRRKIGVVPKGYVRQECGRCRGAQCEGEDRISIGRLPEDLAGCKRPYGSRLVLDDNPPAFAARKLVRDDARDDVRRRARAASDDDADHAGRVGLRDRRLGHCSQAHRQQEAPPPTDSTKCLHCHSHPPRGCAAPCCLGCPAREGSGSVVQETTEIGVDSVRRNAAFRAPERWTPRSGTGRMAELDDERKSAMPRVETIRGLERGLQVLRFLHSEPISSLHDIHAQRRYPSPACCASSTRWSGRAWSRGVWPTAATG